MYITCEECRIQTEDECPAMRLSLAIGADVIPEGCTEGRKSDEEDITRSGSSGAEGKEH